MRGATTTCPTTAVSLCVLHKLPIHGWLPRARFRHQFSHRASFDVSTLLASALMVEDLATLFRLIAVLKLITLCAPGGSHCAPPIAPLPLPPHNKSSSCSSSKLPLLLAHTVGWVHAHLGTRRPSSGYFRSYDGLWLLLLLFGF